MRTKLKTSLTAFFFSMFLFLVFVVPCAAEEYEALKGVKTIKTILDFRDGNPMSALVHIKLVHETYNDIAIRNITNKPDFVVVFMDSSVKLLSKSREGFSAEEKKMLDEMDHVISAMSKDGIRLEVCLYAVNFLGVDPASITSEINRVSNGWISSMGYQAMGFSLVPAF